jgi:hypothetical protein
MMPTHSSVMPQCVGGHAAGIRMHPQAYACIPISPGIRMHPYIPRHTQACAGIRMHAQQQGVPGRGLQVVDDELNSVSARELSMHFTPHFTCFPSTKVQIVGPGPGSRRR